MAQGGHSYTDINRNIVPTSAVIAADLVGTRLSEGVENGYFYPDWRWTVEKGEIKSIKILSRNISGDYCTFVVSLILQARSCPTKYNAVVKVDYYLEDSRWEMRMTKSQGINIVKTDRYFDCITTKFTEESFSHPKPMLQIKNNTDSRIIVGGIYRPCKSTEWRKFSSRIGGLSSSLVGVLVEGVEEYRIEFVELD